ncbi:MAG: formyltransferase family protein [Candidatus Saccharibacteria bacterium]|nr:formyltransferase family protein [Candidatus Saccharibacteria bacterium]
MNKIIFFGNGPLADAAKNVLEKHCEIIFHARSKEDLGTVKEIKAKNPEARGVLASFGIMIKPDVLDIFEPEGILNIHPSLLPKYRGASPIESAILNGDNEFSVSIMKLVKAMDAGPVYYQTTLNDLPLSKAAIYEALAAAGANWLIENMDNLPEPTAQNEKEATFCGKFDRSMGELTPESDTAEKTFRKIIAYQDFPKPKYIFYGIKCIIKKAHLAAADEQPTISITCADGGKIAIDELQPEGRKAMDAKSFLNGYKK